MNVKKWELRGNHRGLERIGRRCGVVLALCLLTMGLAAGTARAQTDESKPAGESKASKPAGAEGAKEEKGEEAPEPKTDFTVLLGSDFVRPGSLPRGNFSLGMGHAFEILKKDPLGDGVTFGYAYENTGTHGFIDSDHGEHSELLGQMRDFKLSEKFALYNWLQGGISSLTGDAHVANRFSWNESVGVKIHLSRNSAIWVQETYNKVVTLPWYTVTAIGFTYSR